MRRVLAMGLVLVATLGLTRCAHATRTTRAAPAGEPVLRVMTYNVNFGLGGEAETLAAIGAPDADVIFLQETTPAWERSVRAALGTTYRYQAWLHAPAAGGLAVLSKRPFDVKDVLENPGGWFPALRVVTQTPVGPVQALVVHLHPPVTEDGSWVRGYTSTGRVRHSEVAHWLPALEPGLATLVVGDFNEGTSGPAVQELERQGLRTALPEFDPRAKTWHWPVGPLQLSAQFDHVAYSAQLDPLTARVEPRGQSDHFPVVAEFVRAKRPVMRPPAPSGSSLSVSLH
jgi:endonuclease/exonuclease/phosphatase (EEP) superfamily protein YafD